ncbi:Carbamoyl-phosphate synthase large chain [Frankliniella fusca]|uniref:Carbamoyl-phosphate synthase large chain n=1 Tax=Frankliniella fusca TaxID=407009 RepID=A0AAE1GWS1_9NEOP|nr:Carbamoyl-phosphate synthase large chain [Frankliniella fusca]
MAPTKRVTRTAPSCWLIGGKEAEFSEKTRLPVLRSVLRVFLFHHNPPAVCARKACGIVIDELLPFWVKAGIPTVDKKSAVDQLKRIYDEWVLLKKAMNKPTTERREKFIAALDQLFDIAAPNLDKIKCILPEDREFYKSMTEDRKASMIGVDRKWALKKQKKTVRTEGEIRRKRRSDEDTKKCFDKVTLDDSASDTEESETKDSEFSLPEKRTKNVRINVLTKEVTSALDRTQTSSRFGAHLVQKSVTSALQAASCALNLEGTNLKLKPVFSTSSVGRKRTENRTSIVENIQQNVIAHPGPFFVHFDGKLLPDEPDGKKYDRVPVLVTGYEVEQLLGVPRLDSGSGLAQAHATYELLKSWDLVDKVVGAVFDTTSTNTGCHKGACKLLEDKKRLGEEILWCACRHHVFELVLEAVGTVLLGESKDPRLPFFGKLADTWEKIDKTKFRTAASIRKLKCIPETDQIITFCENQLQVHHPRGDYKELCELAILLLGGLVPDKPRYVFKKPGALSKTRWMMRAIYAFKTWMLGRQIEMDASIHSKLFSIAYIRMWFNAPLPAQSPRNDLASLQFLYQNRKEGSHWMAALQKFVEHLWYLSPKLVPLALFDDKLSVEEKKSIASALQTGGKKGSAACLPRAKVELKDSVMNLKLRDFVTADSVKFFEITKISSSFLAKDPTLWDEDSDYLRSLQVVNHFKVVNDSAERGVALVTSFLKGNQLTTDEQQRQLLLLVVAEDRKLNKLP